jgi:hypothetical protein
MVPRPGPRGRSAPRGRGHRAGAHIACRPAVLLRSPRQVSGGAADSLPHCGPSARPYRRCHQHHGCGLGTHSRSGTVRFRIAARPPGPVGAVTSIMDVASERIAAGALGVPRPVPARRCFHHGIAHLAHQHLRRTPANGRRSSDVGRRATMSRGRGQLDRMAPLRPAAESDSPQRGTAEAKPASQLRQAPTTETDRRSRLVHRCPGASRLVSTNPCHIFQLPVHRNCSCALESVLHLLMLYTCVV